MQNLAFSEVHCFHAECENIDSELLVILEDKGRISEEEFLEIWKTVHQ